MEVGSQIFALRPSDGNVVNLLRDPTAQSCSMPTGRTFFFACPVPLGYIDLLEPLELQRLYRHLEGNLNLYYHNSGESHITYWKSLLSHVYDCIRISGHTTPEPNLMRIVNEMEKSTYFSQEEKNDAFRWINKEMEISTPHSWRRLSQAPRGAIYKADIAHVIYHPSMINPKYDYYWKCVEDLDTPLLYDYVDGYIDVLPDSDGMSYQVLRGVSNPYAKQFKAQPMYSEPENADFADEDLLPWSLEKPWAGLSTQNQPEPQRYATEKEWSTYLNHVAKAERQIRGQQSIPSQARSFQGPSSRTAEKPKSKPKSQRKRRNTRPKTNSPPPPQTQARLPRINQIFDEVPNYRPKLGWNRQQGWHLVPGTPIIHSYDSPSVPDKGPDLETPEDFLESLTPAELRGYVEGTLKINIEDLRGWRLVPAESVTTPGLGSSEDRKKDTVTTSEKHQDDRVSGVNSCQRVTNDLPSPLDGYQQPLPGSTKAGKRPVRPSSPEHPHIHNAHSTSNHTNPSKYAAYVEKTNESSHPLATSPRTATKTPDIKASSTGPKQRLQPAKPTAPELRDTKTADFDLRPHLRDLLDIIGEGRARISAPSISGDRVSTPLGTQLQRNRPKSHSPPHDKNSVMPKTHPKRRHARRPSSAAPRAARWGEGGWAFAPKEDVASAPNAPRGGNGNWVWF